MRNFNKYDYRKQNPHLPGFYPAFCRFPASLSFCAHTFILVVLINFPIVTMKFSVQFFLKQAGKMALQHLLLPAVYRIGCWMHRRVRDDLAVFADAHHKGLPFSMEAMYQATENLGYTVRLHVYDYSHESTWKGFCHSIAFMFLYSQARYVFLCDNFLPAASCKKRKETTLVQLWHSCGLLKRMGYDTGQDVPPYYKGNVYRNYDLVTVSAPCCEPCLTSGMRQPPGIVRALGVSRTDVYFDEAWREACRRDFYKASPQARGKKILLWAPTFRGNAASPTLSGMEAVLRLEEELGPEWMVVRKMHPHLDMRAETETGQKLSTCDIPTEQLLAVTDLLITDYSSTLFDYLLFDRPFVLFSPDLEEYRKERGFYIEYESLTPYMVTQEKLLAETVLAAYEGWNRGEDREQLRTVRDYHCQACDGNATRRILDYIEMREWTC